MQYKENDTIELKQKINCDFLLEIIAFLNSYIGGRIYFGVSNNGDVLDVPESIRDLNESKIINWIRDEAIYPNTTDFIKLSNNEDGVLVIEIIPGNNKPYYLKSKGLKPSGVYIRYSRNKAQATQEEITNGKRN